MNIFDYNLDRNKDEEFLTEIFKTKNIKIERIVSFGQTTDWYDQDENEFVILLEGNAEIEFEEKRVVSLKKGDYIIIPSHDRHRVIKTSSNPDCVWLCFFFK